MTDMSDSLAVIIALLQQYSNSHCSFLRYINVINTDIINKKRQMLYNTHSKPIWRQYSSKTNKKLSYRRETDRATLLVMEYFAKSLNVTQHHSKWHCWVGHVYSIQTMSALYSFWDIQCRKWSDLETGGMGVQGHWKWRRSIDHIRLSIGRPW